MKKTTSLLIFISGLILSIVFGVVLVFGYDIKGNLNVEGKATLHYLSEIDNDDTTLFVADHQICPKVYIDWKAAAAADEAYPGSYPIISGDLADDCIISSKIDDGTIVDTDINASAGIQASKINLSGVTWDDFN